VYNIPKDSENFVTNTKGAGRLFPIAKVLVSDNWRPAAIVISNKIYLFLLGQCIREVV
jgi:hypothetical protein